MKRRARCWTAVRRRTPPASISLKIALTTKFNNVVLNIDDCCGPGEYTIFVVLCCKWQGSDILTKQFEIVCQGSLLAIDSVPKYLHLPSHLCDEPIEVAGSAMKLLDDSVPFHSGNNNTTMTSGHHRNMKEVRFEGDYLSVFVDIVETTQALLIKHLDIHYMATARNNNTAA